MSHRINHISLIAKKISLHIISLEAAVLKNL